MSREIRIEIRQEIKPSFADRLFGTLWHWTVTQQNPVSFWPHRTGFAYTEKQARQRSEKVARRIMEGTIRYEYNPAGLTSGDKGK